jgi:hypothetical protein
MHGGLFSEIMICDLGARVLRNVRGDNLGGESAAHRVLTGDA